MNILKSLRHCTSLQRTRIERNKFVGNQAEDFGIYPNSDYIDLSYNEFYGELPSNWSNFKKLTSLKISGSNITGKITTELGEVFQLQRLDLSSNQLFGGIPRSLGNLTLMLELKLNENKLSGNIPLEIGKFSRLAKLSLSTNDLTGKIPEQLRDCMQLGDLNLSQKKLRGSIPSQLGFIPTLETVDLSNNMLIGKIPEQFGWLPSIEKMNLSHNKISRTIPSSFDQCFSLISTYMSYNQLEGPLPNIPEFQKASFGALRNNKTLCVAAMIFLIMTVVGIFFRLNSCKRIMENKPSGPSGSVQNLLSISSFDGKMAYQNIIEATDYLSPNHCIGHGGHESVYKAELPDGKTVAVKKIHAIRKCHSRHSFLAYEFLEGGSLYNMLETDEKALKLPWSKRVNIVKDVANGLCYMHHDFSHPMVHRDISSKNVSLDSQENVHISDFGTARFLSLDSSNLTAFVGTHGYAPPKYACLMEVTAKSDVYSFGVLALEVMVGKHPAGDLSSIFFESSSSSSSSSSSLPLTIPRRMFLSKDILIQRLSTPTTKVEDEVTRISKIALSCLQHRPQSRPTMQEISKELASKRGIAFQVWIF
ncbi:probable leucine-rich repeat receptor-like protein kinase At1g35710 [Coffea eugenioides]|uniref:probable leucine-rich repeat receptor-like protein kinase At1g35710 n=1 Tax=Coffea eugenioides TaxID=49369 RepID=UPI000F604AD8|nr:probable leucine-rich repeat receptor-like protein kinase At1g35710 [Coffea eugenioides]